MIRVFLGLSLLLAASTSVAQATYEARTIRGWTVRVQDSLFTAQATATTEALELLDHALLNIQRTTPPHALDRLRSIPIHLSLTGTRAKVEYHYGTGWLRENGHDTTKANSAEFADMEYFVEIANAYPAMVLEILAYGYWQQHLNPRQRARLNDLHAKARSRKLYKNVLDQHGNKSETPTLESPQIYFSESLTSYLSTNDTYPFVRAELRDYDADIYVFMMETIGTR
jgi:hypothetical protein